MKHEQYDIIIIGAGPAGLIAAIESCAPSRKILILEKMPRPALKLRISGKGRCNITNAAELKEFIGHFGKNGRFLRPAFSGFFNTELLRYFEELGVQFKLERGGRYFPESDKAVEIVDALLDKVKNLNIPLRTNCEVVSLAHSPGAGFRVTIRRKPGKSDTQQQTSTLQAGKVLLSTGGKSYPKTGSSGIGFKLASQLGHTVTPLSPSLVPLETKGNTAQKLQGLSLKNVSVSLWRDSKKIDEGFGEMLFTHFGVSGPVILSLSRSAVACLDAKQQLSLQIDLKPALDHKKLDQRLLREIQEHSKQHLKALLERLLPKSMIAMFLEVLDISQEKTLSEISAEERKHLRMLLKELRLEIIGYRSFDEAIVTSGGVSVKEIDPKTMESKHVKGLYFAGEVIDIDADTGGFNLQAAFSTGWLAGRSM